MTKGSDSKPANCPQSVVRLDCSIHSLWVEAIFLPFKTPSMTQGNVILFNQIRGTDLTYKLPEQAVSHSASSYVHMIV